MAREEAAVIMTDEAETNRDNKTALVCLRLVTTCEDLEREIDVTAKLILETAIPEGTS